MTDRILERIRSGEPLTPSDERHRASCGSCQRATAEIAALDARLRDAAAPFASTPIPDEVLDAEPMQPRALERFGTHVLGLAAAAVVVLAVAVGAMALSPWRPSVADDPPASASPVERATPTAEPRPTPTPTPAPEPEIGPNLVGPFDYCADGVAGFEVTLPANVYAERADAERPACRTFGSVEAIGGRPNLEPRILARVDERPPAFDDGTIVAEESRTSQFGVAMTRAEVRVPESGALAANHTITYVIELGGARFLVIETDAGDPHWVESLDALAHNVRVTEPITLPPAAIAAAEALFAARDVCEDPARAMVVTFPDEWWTNTAVEDLPACSWFAPSFFEFESSATVPDEVEITLEVVEGDYGKLAGRDAWETLTLVGRPATRWLVDNGGERTYEYVIQLGETAESGPHLVARTVMAGEDMDVTMAVLDRLVRLISFAPAPPGASSTRAAISAPPVSAEATEGDFRLELDVQQERYRAGQPVIADITLSYLGDETSVDLWGSGLGVVGSRLRQLDGSIEHGWATTTDCRPHPITPGEPLHKPFAKSGSFSPDEPLAEFYEAYFADPLLRLPPGRWELTAVTGFTVGGGDCGEGPSIDLEVSVEVVVEP
jgi:hypothetical protein